MVFPVTGALNAKAAATGALSATAAATGVLSTAERSYPTSAVRGKSWEDPMLEGRQPRGVTPRPRSRAVKSAKLQLAQERQRRATQVQGQGWQPGGPIPRPRRGGCAGTGGTRGSIPC